MRVVAAFLWLVLNIEIIIEIPADNDDNVGRSKWVGNVN